jgi:hypothetical protein
MLLTLLRPLGPARSRRTYLRGHVVHTGPMTPDDLLGTWSVDARYGPGAMEDWLLYFRGDGQGCFWYGNLMGARAAVFDWRLADGRLTTTTRRQFQTPSGHQEPFRPGGHLQLDLVEVAVTVGVEPTPIRGLLRVLRLPPGTLRWVDDAFGFEGPEPRAWMRPLFDS